MHVLTKSFFPFLGKDATESFEDIGHSDEAREILEKYYVADLDEAVSLYANINMMIEKKKKCFIGLHTGIVV